MTGSTPPLAVLDIDGVVADVRHRLPLIAAAPKDWDAFFAAAGADPVLPEGLALARELAATHAVTWLTGRPERLRTVTRDWLAAHALPAGTLTMRRARDFRPAKVVKERALRRLSAGRRVALVVDDDPAVVAYLRERGWPVRLADWVPHGQTLREAQEGQGRT